MRSSAAPTIRSLLVCLLAISAVGPDTGAESIGKGRYRGVYRVDRWGRTTFDILSVDPALRARLAPLAGRPLEIEATEVEQPMNPGPATVTAIGKVEPIASLIGLSLRWSDSSGANTAGYLQVDEGSGVTVVATVTNRDSKPARLWGQPVTRLDLQIWRHHAVPQDSATQAFTPEGAWSAVLGCEDTSIDASEESSNRFKEPPLDRRPTLAAGESLTWKVNLRGLPANEYEVRVTASGSSAGYRNTFPLATSSLLLDVLTDRSPPSNGLGIELNDAPSAIPSAGGRPLIGAIRNMGKAPLRLVLTAADVEAGFYCYDAAGRRLPPPIVRPEQGPPAPILIEGGAARSFPLVAPKGTELARLVFQHRFESGNPSPEKALLPTGPYASAHVRFAR